MTYGIGTRFKETITMPPPEWLRAFHETFYPMTVGWCQKFMRADEEQRTKYLNGLSETVKAGIRFLMDVTPSWFPGVTPIQAVGFVSTYVVTGFKDLARNAGLDDHNSETLVFKIQQAIQEAIDERQGYHVPIWNPQTIIMSTVDQGTTTSTLDPNDPAVLVRKLREIVEVQLGMIQSHTEHIKTLYENRDTLIGEIVDLKRRIAALEDGSGVGG